MLLGAVLQFALPGLLSRAVATAREKPWSTLGRGLVVFLLTPAVVAISMVTVIGIPVGVVIFATFFVLVTLALTTISYCIGLYVRGPFARTDVAANWSSRILWTILGIFILVIVGIVPLVGGMVVVLALIAGLGAVVGEFWQMSHPEKAGAV